MLVMLVGYRGSGKSTVGRRLASDLWLKFADTDQLIAKEAGKGIAEIFRDEGEQRFREIESRVVCDCCRWDDHVIALGGGAVLWRENREAIKACRAKVVYLRCEPEVLHQRIHADPLTAASRPALTKLGGGLEEIAQLLKEREPLYREVALRELDVTSIGPEDAARHIARML